MWGETKRTFRAAQCGRGAPNLPRVYPNQLSRKEAQEAQNENFFSRLLCLFAAAKIWERGFVALGQLVVERIPTRIAALSKQARGFGVEEQRAMGLAPK